MSLHAVFQSPRWYTEYSAVDQPIGSEHVCSCVASPNHRQNKTLEIHQNLLGSSSCCHVTLLVILGVLLLRFKNEQNERDSILRLKKVDNIGYVNRSECG